jgi:hypothetical protein
MKSDCAVLNRAQAQKVPNDSRLSADKHRDEVKLNGY